MCDCCAFGSRGSRGGRGTLGPLDLLPYRRFLPVRASQNSSCISSSSEKYMPSSNLPMATKSPNNAFESITASFTVNVDVFLKSSFNCSSSKASSSNSPPPPPPPSLFVADSSFSLFPSFTAALVACRIRSISSNFFMIISCVSSSCTYPT